MAGLEPATPCLQSMEGKTLNAFAGVANTENQRNSRSSIVPKLSRNAPSAWLGTIAGWDCPAPTFRLLLPADIHGITDQRDAQRDSTGRRIHRARDCAIWLPGLAQAELKRIAGLPRNGVPAGRSNMQEAFVGKTEPRA